MARSSTSERESIPLPELPEVTVYIEALERHILDRELQRVRIQSASLLKSVEAPASAAEG